MGVETKYKYPNSTGLFILLVHDNWLYIYIYILIIYIITSIYDWKSIFAFLFLIFGIIYLGREIYYSLNLKTMYIAKNKLFIHKYLGQGLELALKDCIIFQKMVTDATNVAGVSTCEINTINTHSTLYIFLESNSTNIDETSILLRPHVVNYLVNVINKHK